MCYRTAQSVFMSDTELERSVGALKSVTDIFSRKWTPVVLYTVRQQLDCSYAEINALIDGISDKMLSSSLDNLQDLGLVTKSEDDGQGVTYHATADGEAFCSVLEVAIGWQLRRTEEETCVLVVEDEPMAADILVQYLQDSYQVTHSPSGRDALESLSPATDIVVLDRRLDELTGSEVASRIRSEADSCLVLVVSAVRPGEQLADLPVDDYVQKPVREDAMVRRLKALEARLRLEASEREYLAVESRRRALEAERGRQATSMAAYDELIEKASQIDLSEERKEALKELL